MTGMDAPLASIIIPTYNRVESLRRAVRSILEQTAPRDSFEVVVVDNNSTDDTPRVASEFAPGGLAIRSVSETRLSFTAARHSGAAAARGRYLCYIDDDVVVNKHWLAAIIQTFQSSDRVGMVAGPVHPQFEVQPPDWIKRHYTKSIWLSLWDRGDLAHEDYGAVGPNLSVRKHVLEEVGGFPPDTIGVEAEGRPGVVEKIYVGPGDYGLSNKVRAAGYKIIYAPAAWVYHVIPPVRLTKSWWHSRLAGEGCYHALTRQHENRETPFTLRLRSGYSKLRARLKSARTQLARWTGGAPELHEFWASYFATRARVESALARNPELADQLWEAALTGVAPAIAPELIRELV
jgi:GT2 family glycosyltransferase